MAIFGEIFRNWARRRTNFGGKGVDWWVKSVATKLLIPYDEVGTSRLSDLHGLTSGEAEETTNTKNTNDN